MNIYVFKDDIDEINNRLSKTIGDFFQNRTVLVTGGAGFLGSWICDVLVSQGAQVICLDNLSSGLRENIKQLQDKSNFLFLLHDISKPIFFGIKHSYEYSLPDVKKIDIVMHMASRASPFEFTRYPISILKSNTLGTYNALGIATAHNAIFYYSSTSEIYGNPPSDAIPTPDPNPHARWPPTYARGSPRSRARRWCHPHPAGHRPPRGCPHPRRAAT